MYCKKGRGEEGQILLVVAISLSVIIGVTGLAVDLGIVYLERGKLRNAADAIALAAAQELPSKSYTLSKADEYAWYNGLTPGQITVTTPYEGDSQKVEVIANKQVPHFFMKLLGFTSSKVVGRAVAGLEKTGENMLPIAVPDTALSGGCILWGPSSQCNDLSPSKGGSLGAQYKGLVNLGQCDESAQGGSGDCTPFTPAVNYGNKPKNIQGWVSNGCDCEVYQGNDLPLYNGNLGNNMSGPLTAACNAQGTSDASGSYGLFTVLVYDEVLAGSPDRINVSGYAVYKIYCSDIQRSSAAGTFVEIQPALNPDNLVPEGFLKPTLLE